MATNEIERPMASTAGPQRCSEAAAPSTTGRMGSTQGDRIESTPAINASASAPAVMAGSQCLVQQRGDRGAFGIAGRAAGFGFTLEGDQRGLRARAEIFHRILLAVEVDDEVDQVLELGLGRELAQDRLLRLAGRTPRCMDCYQDRFPRLLGRRKGLRIERLGLEGQGPGGKTRACGYRRKNYGTVVKYDGSTPRPDAKEFFRADRRCTHVTIGRLEINFRSF